MPKTAYSPPPSPRKQTQTQNIQSLSESDSSSKGKLDQNRKVSARSKRLRLESSPQATEGEQRNFNEFKNELMMMLNTWKAEQSATLSKLVSDVAAVKTQCSEIQKSNSEIEASMSFMNTQFEEIKQRIERLEMEKQQNRQYLIGLEKHLEELQQLSRCSSIEVRNVREKDKETESDLIHIIKTLGNTLDVTFHENDIRDIYRRPGKPGTTKTIVAEFNSVLLKNNFLASSRRFNRSHQGPEKLNYEHIGLVGAKQPIYVDEHLPYSTRKLLFQARDFAKKQDFKFCWISNGRVLLRKDSNSKFIHVKTESCLTNLLK